MFKRWFTQSAVFAMLVAGIYMMSGCGNVTAPLSPGQVSRVQQAGKSSIADDTPFAIFFSTKGTDPLKALRSSKPTLFNTVQGPFSNALGGSLSVSMPPDTTGAVVLQTATFVVVPGSLDTTATISGIDMAGTVTINMTGMYGTALTDVAVKFTPSGMAFTPPATLTMLVTGPVTDAQLAALTAFHFHSGIVETIPFQALRTGTNEVTITVGVPGFSSYSLGDDYAPETIGAPGSGG